MLKFLIVATVFLILMVLCIRVFENQMIFFPFKYPRGNWRPDTFNIKVEESLFYSKDGTKLHGWYIPHKNPEAVMLFCHGNAGNISDRLDNLARLHDIAIDVFIFDYRGYGKSEGHPDEQGVYQDAAAAYEFLIRQKNIDPEKLIIFGRSLGGAVAVELTSQISCAGLILESTFTSAQDMAKSMFGGLPIGLFIKSRFNSEDKVLDITVPKLFIHGNRDMIVPYDLGRNLFKAAPEPKSFYTIEGADHNNTYIIGGSDYFQRLSKFILSCVKKPVK